MKILAFCFFFSCLARLAACATDAVLRDGDSVTIKNKTGELVVSAEQNLKRNFTWNGQTRSVVMLERQEPWLGSKSIYFPGPGEHWAENHGITRGVVEEGKRSFKNSAEFRKWLRHDYQRYLDFTYLGRGRIGGWAIVKGRKQMNCAIWEIRIGEEFVNKIEFQQAVGELDSKVRP